ncbi:single-stranded-DNA-specific exonuclease RecJ [Candidatus Gracilibacteria bacterium]|nr:single-stranded-DNA-specific exonuclease RecJ [Candidatus Gracilibacteria bacterium]
MANTLPTYWRVLQSRSPAEPLAEVLLRSRHRDPDKFFSFDYQKGIHDPFLFRHMSLAVSRIKTAVENQEKIMIAGDYDLDGISGTAALLDFFRYIRFPVLYKLPHRVHDGYGLSAATVVEAKKNKVSVIITVDNGISCLSEILMAQSLGIDVIITDHHTIPAQIPNAFAILHPKIEEETYPDADLTGSGVAYKFATALARTFLPAAEAENYCKWLLDLATLGTIADMGPLTGENRQIVHYGLQIMDKQRRPGLKQLLAVSGHKDPRCLAETVGFKLGPRLNASGRMADAGLSVQLLMATTELEAEDLALQIERLNTERKVVAEQTFLVADQIIQKGNIDDAVLIANSENFHPGVIGLVAGKLAERYQRPIIMLERRPDKVVGSARSIPQIDLMEALNDLKPFFLKYGGHAQAAGFSVAIEQEAPFIAALRERFQAFLPLPARELILDTDLYVDDISIATHQTLDQFEPFGIANPKPLFFMGAIEVVAVKPLGSDQKHWKLDLKECRSGRTFEAVAFNTDRTAVQGTLDLGVRLGINTWNGISKPQLIIEHLQPSSGSL